MAHGQEPCNSFPEQCSDELLAKGLVSSRGVAQLEETLIRLYLERARDTKKNVVILADHEHYQTLRRSGAVFDGGSFYLFVDESFHHVLDMTPVAYHLLDTQEGLFYAKFMQQPKDRPSQTLQEAVRT